MLIVTLIVGRKIKFKEMHTRQFILTNAKLIRCITDRTIFIYSPNWDVAAVCLSQVSPLLSHVLHTTHFKITKNKKNKKKEYCWNLGG